MCIPSTPFGVAKMRARAESLPLQQGAFRTAGSTLSIKWVFQIDWAKRYHTQPLLGGAP
ncbi:MAG: hypothetical protein LBJ70_03690 [Holosporales bacterium]|nr:hypothetical protein [Holosporales bacterium]